MAAFRPRQTSHQFRPHPFRREDMPYLPDGTPIDIVLNRWGFPHGLNVGQVFEIAWMGCGPLPFRLPRQGWCLRRDARATKPPRTLFRSILEEGGCPPARTWVFTNPITPARSSWWMGRTALTPFDQPVTDWLCPHPQTRSPGGRQDPRPLPPVPTRSSPSKPWAQAQQGRTAARGRWRSGLWRPTALLTPCRNCLTPSNPTNMQGRNEALNAIRQGASQIPRPGHAESFKVLIAEAAVPGSRYRCLHR